MSSVRKAIAYSSVTQYSSRIISIFSIAIIARILTPEELGVYAIASSIALLASELRLLGIANFIVREKDLTPNLVSSALGLTMIISWGLGILMLSTSAMIADYYNYQILREIIWILSISFFLAPYISVISSLYSRDLNYRILLFIRLPAQIIGFIFTLYLIYIDVGIFALAWGSAVTIFLEFITSLLFRNRSYPLYPSFRYLKQILRFGIFNSGSTLLFRISTTAPDLIIGKLGSSVDVAMYSRGLGFVDFLSNFLIMGAKPIALPYLAQVRRSGGSLSDAYIASTSMLCTITWPALGFASIMSLQTLRVIFGDQWDAASPLVSYLTLWAGFRMTHTLSQSYLISTGNEKVMFFKEVAGVSLVIFAIYFAFPYGLVYVAAAMAIASFIEMLITMITLKYFADLKVTLFVKELIPVTFLTLVCWVSIVGFSELDWIKQLSDFIQLVVTGMINLAIWVLFLWAFRLRLFREIKSTFTKHSKNP